MKFQNIASRDSRRITWPINITIEKEGADVLKITDRSWWTVFSNDVFQKRYNRFAVVLLANHTYNFTFSSEPPKDMRFQIQKSDKYRYYEEEWAAVKIYYPVKNSIRVRVKGRTVDPLVVNNSNTESSLSKICGGNKFYYNDQIIEFMVNGDRTCFPRVTLTNSIYLHTKFNMDLKTFYEMDGVTKFIDRICALLKIQDYSRVKIVGVYEGSVVVDSFIEEK